MPEQVKYMVKVERELPEQFFRDVMGTAVESGYSAVFYWAAVGQVKRDDEIEVLRFNVREVLNEDTGALASPVEINPERIRKAIQEVMDGKHLSPDSYIRGYITSAVLEADAGDIDATAADVLVQIVTVGEVRYG